MPGCKCGGAGIAGAGTTNNTHIREEGKDTVTIKLSTMVEGKESI